MLYMIVARYSTLDEFGVFSIAMSYATLAAILIDYGLTQSLLQNIGKSPQLASRHTTEGIQIKAVLTLINCTIFIVIFFSTLQTHPHCNSIALIFIYSILNSYCEYFGAALRATGNYAS